MLCTLRAELLVGYFPIIHAVLHHLNLDSAVDWCGAIFHIGPYLSSWVMGHLVSWINSKCICVCTHMCVCNGSFGKPGSHLAYSRLPVTPEITERLLQSITCRQGLVWKLERTKERGKMTNEKRDMALRDVQWWNKMIFLLSHRKQVFKR